MITRNRPIGAVCFRCRLRLFHHVTPIRYFTDDASSAGAQHGDEPVGSDGASRGAHQDWGSREKSKSRLLMKRLDLRTRHVSGNRVLDERTASLGSNILGTPAHAIVMRDGGKVRRRKFPPAPNQDQPESSDNSPHSIEALLDSESTLPTQDEVRSNIGHLRPESESVLTEKEFTDIYENLVSGFFRVQLKDYISWYQSTVQRPANAEFPWIKEMSPWLPLQGYIPETATNKISTSKGKLAMRLMVECWGLSIAEVQTELGVVELKLRPYEFSLLMRGSQRFMKSLGRTRLEPGEKVEALRDQRTLLFVATKPKAELLVNDLNEILKKVTTKSIPILLFASEPPDHTILEEVGRITNSHVRQSDTGKRLHVTWVESRHRPSLEDVAHIVFRLLLTAFGPQRATSTLLSPMAPEADHGRLIVDPTSEDKLTWRDRLTQWARYMLPTSLGGGDANAPLLIEEFELPFEPMERPKPLDAAVEFFPETGFPLHPIKWSSASRTSTVAHFGQVLHPYPQSSSPAPLLSDLLAGADRRIFAPRTPHPLHLVEAGTTNPDDSSALIITKSTVVLRFWPSPSSSPASRSDRRESVPKHAGDAPPAPILELRLAAVDDEIKGVESLRAISRIHHTDVMLPSSLVDLRFTQTQYETLQAPNREALGLWQPLVDLLADSRLDLKDGKLEVPPRQRFPIPRRLFTTDPSTDAAPSPLVREPADSADEDPVFGSNDSTDKQVRQQQQDSDLVSVSYEFVGLEFHHSVTLPYEGHQLTYTSIEAGQGGGRRTEVTLEPLEPDRSVLPLTKEGGQDGLQDDFLMCCSRFAADHSLWSGIDDPKQNNS